MNDIVIKTEGLTKYFGRKPALDHLTVSIPRGCICGFLGRNGAGKTTAIKLLLGLLQPTVGSSAVLGQDSMSLTPESRARIGYVTEGHHLFRWMTIAALENFQRAFFPDQWDRSFFADMIEYFDLSPKQKIKHLSNGQRAQVSLALTLAPNPEVLIMDDPTLGLDPAIRRQFLEGMIQLIMKQGRTVLFSSHILADVERVCDRLLVLDRGVLRADCTLEQFRQSVRRIRVTFNEQVPTEIDVAGLLNHDQQGNQADLLLIGTPQQALEQWMDQSGVVKHEILPLTLEDQFIEFTEPGPTRRPLRWEDY